MMRDEILAVLTDEPKTAEQIAGEIGSTTRKVASALCWMRDVAWDGCGFAVIVNGERVMDYPHAEWHSYSGLSQWVRIPQSYLDATTKAREIHA